MALRRPATAPLAILRRWVQARPAGGAAAVAGNHCGARRGEARNRRGESDVRTLPEGDWYDILRNPTLRDSLLHTLETGSLVELEVRDDANDSCGLMVAEIISQRFAEGKSYAVQVIQPLAAEQGPVLEWAKENRTAPSCVYDSTRRGCCGSGSTSAQWRTASSQAAEDPALHSR